MIRTYPSPPRLCAGGYPSAAGLRLARGAWFNGTMSVARILVPQVRTRYVTP